MKTMFCHYEACEFLDGSNLVQTHGVAEILNQNMDGIVVLSMEFAPHLGQIIEVSHPQSFLFDSVSLYEVRWTRPDLSPKASGGSNRVGCRLIVGSLH